MRRHHFKQLYDFYYLTTAFTIYICTSYTVNIQRRNTVRYKVGDHCGPPFPSPPLTITTILFREKFYCDVSYLSRIFGGSETREKSPTTLVFIDGTNNNGRDMGDERARTCSGPGGDDTSERRTINTSAYTDTHTFLNGRRPPRYYNIH